MNVIAEGGVLLYPILVCSVVALAVVLERTVVFLRSVERRQRIEPLLRAALDGDGAALVKLRQVRGPLSAVACAYFEGRYSSAMEQEDAVFRAGGTALMRLRRRIKVLAVTAQLTPLMGLLGTVVGMIDVFRQMELSAGRASVDALAGGIWVALLTTAFGFGVAIPALAAQHLFEGVVQSRHDLLKEFVGDLESLEQDEKGAEGDETASIHSA